jgi:hypothetical protein
MSHPSKGVINLYDSNDESVGSNIEEVVQWDKELRNTKTFMTAVIILSGWCSLPDVYRVRLLTVVQARHTLELELLRTTE